MKLKRITAGLASLAVASTMALSAYADTTIEVNQDPEKDAFSNCFASYENADGDSSDDYIDAKTFTKDQDLTVTIDFEWNLPAGLPDDQKYCLVAPGRGNKTAPDLKDKYADKVSTGGWEKLGGEKIDAITTDFPQANHLEAGYTLNDEDVQKDGVTEPIFVKKDGFICVRDESITSLKFTINKDEVNYLIENANAEDEDGEKGWDGLIFQTKQMNIKTITLSQDNVKLGSESLKDEEGGDSSDASASTAEDSKAEDSKEESKADSSSDSKAADSKSDSSKSEDNKDDGLSTGAIVGIAIGALVIIGGAIVVVTKKK